MLIIPYVEPIGQYQKEALLRERDELWSRRHSLTPGEGQRLDRLLSNWGVPAGYESAGQGALAEEMLRHISGKGKA